MHFHQKGGRPVKRVLILALTLAVLLSLMVLPASASNTVSKMDIYCTLGAGGSCQVTVTMSLVLDTSVSSLSFPLPSEAENIELSGSKVNPTKTPTSLEVDLSRYVNGLLGETTIRLDFTLPNVVKVVENEKTTERHLQLQLPLLTGFAFPVDYLNFVVYMPGAVTAAPRFTSTYRQESIDSDLTFVVNNNMITGQSRAQLHDHDSVMMTLDVPSELFPTISLYGREGNPEIIPMLICVGAALLYWLLFLRTLPLRKTRTANPPQGVSAGEIGCHLTLAGGDLTMMVMSWAQLGYIMIQLDEHGRVLLHKRMDMGNERSLFEMRIYKLLFGSRRVIDATGGNYARLCLKVQRMIPGEKSMYRPSSGNMKIFRVLCCASHVFCGICVAMNMSTIGALQVLLSIVLGALGAVTAWLIQDMAYRTHIRGKVPVYIGLACQLIWVVLGLLAGQVWVPLCSVLAQELLGFFAAYGGRRSDMGRADASLILGLRRYMKKVDFKELERLQRNDPDYFFQLAPYALALGVVTPFAKNFGARRLDQCPYLVTRVHGKRTAEEWAALLKDVADAMDHRHRKMMVQRWIPIQFR